jgi:4-hydroxythreonine-4-phosphate dehydrogenase
MGDPSGIGPVIALKAIKALAGFAEFTVIGDAGVLNRVGARGCRIDGSKLIDLDNVKDKNFSFGRVKAEYGRAALEYLDKALELLREKEIDCLVTCPVSKEAVNKAGIKFCGHTEYLASRTKTKEFVMLLLNKKLKIALLTRHIPLNKVSGALSKDKIYKTILLTYRGLQDNFRIKKPRLVVCGLNPHASDNGLIGSEENALLKPAIAMARLPIDGPICADMAFYNAYRGEYDAVIAAYHDQALIPLKLSGNRNGVNLTLGLPFVRTSPLHGTAFDIADKAVLVDSGSMIEAIKTAIRCTLNQKNGSARIFSSTKISKER